MVWSCLPILTFLFLCCRHRTMKWLIPDRLQHRLAWNTFTSTLLPCKILGGSRITLSSKLRSNCTCYWHRAKRNFSTHTRVKLHMQASSRIQDSRNMMGEQNIQILWSARGLFVTAEELTKKLINLSNMKWWHLHVISTVYCVREVHTGISRKLWR